MGELRYYFHGGVLPDLWTLHNNPVKDRYKKGRCDAGYGLYLVDHWETAKRYQKGNRKLYVVGVEMGIGKDIGDVYIYIDDCYRWVMNQFSLKSANELWDRFLRLSKDGRTIRAEYFDNIIVEYRGMNGSKARELIKFLVGSGVGYRKVFNRFGFGENMLVVYDVGLIRDIEILKWNDMVYSIDEYKNKKVGLVGK